VFWLSLALVLLWPLGVATEFRPWVLWAPENRKVTADFVASFWPLVHNAEFMQMVVRETWRTVAMATAGVTLALVLAVPLSLMATRVLSLSALSGRMDRWPAVVRWCVRATLIVLRSVPELVWALVYAEILESGESHATQTLMRNGSGRLQAFVYALLPSHAAELASYTVYRWECAIRSSVVLGFVGAGGLGQQLDNSMKMFNGGEVATLLLVFIALVALADRVSAWLRKALA
jgi:phosphonate transport system permease protein